MVDLLPLAALARLMLRRTVTSPRSALGILLFPAAAFWLLIQMLGKLAASAPALGGEPYLAFTAPALAAYAGVPFAMEYALLWEQDRRSGMVEQLLAANLAWGSYLAALIACVGSAAVLGALSVLSAALLSGFTLRQGPQEVASVFLAGFVLDVLFASVAGMAAACTHSVPRARLISAVVLGASTLASDLLLPDDVLPSWIDSAAAFSPVSLAVHAARVATATRPDWESYLAEMSILIAAAVTGVITVVVLAARRSADDAVSPAL